jgi:hypothetical protein
MKNIEEEEAERIFFTEKEAKAEAERLVNKYRPMFYGRYSIPAKKKAKMCALIGVDLVLDVARGSNDIDHVKFWREVKKQIENI